MIFWILAASYWVHLLSTIVWLGGIVLMAFIAWPALNQGTLDANQWFQLQKRFLPWVNASLVLLLITGFIQMTNDENYSGFLAIDSLWAWAMLLKHVAYVVMVALTATMQFILYPAMTRAALLAQTRPETAAAERDKLAAREIRYLRLNVAAAMIVLLFTAIATAV
ncbi:MAG: CopD family protein [Anaerolineae bacterium]|nr:CopD family protein [Anaerolineae bacterium]